MSCWTHITSCMSVETDITEHNILELVKEYLDKAPKITGSEGDADVFVNLQSGYNFVAGTDCEHCEYGKTVRPLKDGWFECDGPEGYNCPSGHYQTCVVISIQGDLRDRVREQTEKEFNKFKKYIEKKYYIRDYSLNIDADY